MAAWAGYSFFIAGMLVMRVPKEDEVLREKFGAEWEVYARRTPYRLIPYIY